MSPFPTLTEIESRCANMAKQYQIDESLFYPGATVRKTPTSKQREYQVV